MADYKVDIKKDVLNKLSKQVIRSLEQTAEALHTDLVQSQTMPFDTGNLQGESTFVAYEKASRGTVNIVSSTAYARRLYYHPEYNFSKLENSKASGLWLETYLSGDKKDLASKTFKKLYKSNTGV